MRTPERRRAKGQNGPARSSPSERARRLIQAVARYPDSESYVWDGRPSLLAYVIFHSFVFLRLFSVLQWIKYFTRGARQGRAPGFLIAKTSSYRHDFHARHTELYFLFVLLSACALWLLCELPERYLPAGWGSGGVLHYMHSRHRWVVFGACYWLIESSVWIFYYLLVRSYVERDYRLYDKAEYLVQLPVVIVLQWLLFSVAFDMTIGDVLTISLSGVASSLSYPQSWLQHLVRFNGVSYFAIGIAILVNSHPGLPTREHRSNSGMENRRALSVTIIGAGDVVVNRLIGGLLHAGVPAGSISVLELCAEDSEIDIRRQQIRKALAASLRGAPNDVRIEFGNSNEGVAQRAVELGAPVFISCPSRWHYVYLKLLATAGSTPFAVEKPLLIEAPHIRELTRNPALMRRGFALSYYTQEKALPLLWFLNPTREDSKFLDLDYDADVSAIRSQLGELQAATICLHEGPDGRAWPFDPAQGGQYFETVIHPLMIWFKIMKFQEGAKHLHNASRNGLGSLLSRTEWCQPPHDSPSYVHLRLENRGIFCDISCGKGLGPQLFRGAILQFEHGRVLCDFGSPQPSDAAPGIVVYSAAGDELLSIHLKADYAHCKYSVLVERFIDFVERQHGTWGDVGEPRSDEFSDQLLVLEFISGLCGGKKKLTRRHSSAEIPAELNEEIRSFEVACVKHTKPNA